MLDAEFALNEGAGGELDANGKPVALQIQAGEKVYQDFTLDSLRRRRPQLSAEPRTTPSCGLAAGIAKLGAYNFPVALNEATAAISRRNPSSYRRRWPPTCRPC